MALASAQAHIESEVISWKGMSAHPHRFGGVEFRLDTREIGHLHGNKLLDIPFPSKVRDELVEAGEVRPHHVVPDSGWISFYIREEGDVEKAIALLRKSYEIASRQRAK